MWWKRKWIPEGMQAVDLCVILRVTFLTEKYLRENIFFDLIEITFYVADDVPEISIKQNYIGRIVFSRFPQISLLEELLKFTQYV